MITSKPPLESVGNQDSTNRSIANKSAPTRSSDERVSVVIPCYNEERFIVKALQNLVNQYEHDRFEIIIVDGMSEDRTRELIAEFQRSRPDLAVRLIDNPARTIPAAINLGVKFASGDIIARLDAHAVASPGYIRRCVEVLRGDGVGVVGMPCKVCPGADTLMARAIAMAVSHPFGIGDAKYRLRSGGAPQEVVDTVAFACFAKSLWTELGGFNESLLTNEDYDFNYRVKLSGKLVLLDRSEHCEYFARTTFGDLAAQYWRYGTWKARMIRGRPRSLKWRHTVAPAFVASLLTLVLAGFWFRPAWWLLAIELSAYLLFALFFAFRLARESGAALRLMLLMPIVFCTIHLTWGTGVLLGMIRPDKKKPEYCNRN